MYIVPAMRSNNNDPASTVTISDYQYILTLNTETIQSVMEVHEHEMRDIKPDEDKVLMSRWKGLACSD